MLTRLAAAAAALSLAAMPCAAAELPGQRDPGARRSGAVIGGYVRLPLGGKAERRAPAAGLRLAAVHDYRSAGAERAAFVESDTVDLRLLGARKPALFVAGIPVTGKQARRRNLNGVSTLVTVAVIAAAVVGGYYIVRAIDDSGEE